MKERTVTAIFLGLWIAVMVWWYWITTEKNIIYFVVGGLATALVFWLWRRQIPQIEAAIRNGKTKRSAVEIIENTAVLLLGLFGCSMFWLGIFGFLPSEVSLRNILLALGLIALVILGKLYRKYKDRAILIVMIIVVFLLLGGFLLIL